MEPPLMINPLADNLAKVYGISDKRYFEMMNKCSEAMVYLSKEPVQTVAQQLNLMIPIANNEAEKVVIVHMHTRWLLLTGRIPHGPNAFTNTKIPKS